MFTACPECQKIHALTLQQLRANRGMMRCTQCSVLFDALASISESAAIGPAEQKLPGRLPWDARKTPGNAYWGTGLLIGLTLLIAQIVYFEGHALSQNPTLRPHLEEICQFLNCGLPAYKNPEDFSVLHGSFAPLPNHHYAFRAIIVNQAVFPQAYPAIKLTLLDYNEKPFAHRIFQPQDYLSEAMGATAMAADATAEIRLTIAAPATKVGGYTFKLI